MTAELINTWQLNTARPNNSSTSAPPVNVETEMARLQDSKPITKIEFIDTSDVVTDITAYYLEGAQVNKVKDRRAGEIQAGDFDLVVSNQDNKFSEYDTSSLIYNAQYHGARIRISEGFILSDGTTVYEDQCVGYIDQLVTDSDMAKVTFRCRDLIKRIMDQTLNSVPTAEVPVEGSNTGNGTFGKVSVLPFATVDEDWTVVCTTGGADGVALFSVTGSVSGSIGPATSGSEFSNSTHGIKFTITAGSTVWSVGDRFTFSTKGFPQWNGLNPAKILWSVLTGYDFDSDVQESFSDLVLDLDHTQSDSNVDIDYDSFVDASTNFDISGIFDLKGYIQRDQTAVDFISNLLVMFLGSLFTDTTGRLSLKMYFPSQGTSDTVREFLDSKKITKFGYNRSIDEVVNYVVVNFKAVDSWDWSSDSITLQGVAVTEDATSISKYGQISDSFDLPWFSSNGQHAQDFANKMVTRYAEPPLNIDLITGLDALKTDIGDVVQVTDTKYNISQMIGEVTSISKNFDDRPVHVALRVRRDPTLSSNFGFWGSTANEGDGLSPESLDYDTASASDKNFSYLGDETDPAGTAPDYRMF